MTEALLTDVLNYLLNSLWQVPLIYAVAALSARLLAPLGSRAGHRLWVLALGIQVVLPGCAFSGSLLLHRFWSAAGDGATVRVSEGPVILRAAGLSIPRSVAQVSIGLYLAVTAYLAVRFLWRLRRTRQLTRSAHPVSASPVPMGTTTGISGPVTVGVRRSILLLPPGFLERVTPAELEAVLAHEAAHIGRRDYLKNLIYQAASLPAAYHPALWLTRTRISETREMVCDEMAALSLAGGTAPYARTLLRLATVLFRPVSAANLHAIGILDANIFERRIMNLTQPPVPARPVRRIALLASCGAIALGMTVSALALRVHLSAPALLQESPQPRIAAGVMAGRVVLRKNPVYPAEAKANKDIVDGSVVLDAVIGKDGSVESLKVLKSLRADYDASALEAVKQWTYTPYLLNGQPTAVETTITVTYSTDNTQK